MSSLNKIYKRNKEVISYLFWGVLTTIINIAIFDFIQKFYPSINYQINNAIAWIISALFAFFTNRWFVFHSINKGLKKYTLEMISFLGGRFFSLIVEDIILWIGISEMSGNAYIVKIIGEIFVIAFNYFWSKIAVFNQNK